MSGSLLHAVAARLPEPLLRRAGQWQLRSPAFRRLIQPAMRSVAAREATIGRGVGAGLRFNPHGANPGYALGITEPEVQRMLAEHLASGATFYDVGANVGFFTVLGARLVGSSGKVYAFEPVPAAADSLRRNVQANRFTHVEIRREAVCDAVGEAPLHVSSQLAWASLHPQEGATIVPTPTVTVDHVVAAGARPPDVVKMDIEGAELAALRGMSATLREHGPVLVCEFHDTFADCVEVLEAAGYSTLDVQTRRPVTLAEGAGRHFAGLCQRTPQSTPTSGPAPGPGTTL